MTKNLELLVSCSNAIKSIRNFCSIRISLLEDTIEDLHLYFQEALQWNLKSVPTLFLDCMHRLYGVLYFRLLDTCSIIKALSRASIKFAKFDLLELALRRYLFQLQKMVSPEQFMNQPSELIDLPEARAFWEENVGQVYYTDFDDFCKRILPQVFPMMQYNEDFALYLEHFLNFPEDNLMTTCKWNNITRIFGFKNFEEEFCKYALGKGFCGLINQVEAFEIINEQPDNTYLLRFSRMQPDVLTITTKICHRRNDAKEDGQPVPIGEFLNNHCSDLEPCSMGLSKEALRSKPTLNDLVFRQVISGYVMTYDDEPESQQKRTNLDTSDTSSISEPDQQPPDSVQKETESEQENSAKEMSGADESIGRTEIRKSAYEEFQ
eukprot:CAMPEP_0168548958 /NCGR_PEP_ID=MMETSP0413-20121227/4847_1 /TAXON_ID=136452 /ORGANISM="Filamoeba nolandi, Strain NC-AS-23-1" /LENGTH=377 /DNA_ID=CAMNT_0008579313 /DNA_START=229 /DNA_END=1362 /DNA_ORIENTATION=-